MTEAKSRAKSQAKVETKAKRKTKSKSKPKTRSTSKAERSLEKMRNIIAAWPETDERLSHGSPTFWGGKKTFASFHDDHHNDGRTSIWCKAGFDLQGDLLEGEPEVFYIPPYVGPSGWVGIWVDDVEAKVDWGMVAGVLEQGYRSVAHKRALTKLDED